MALVDRIAETKDCWKVYYGEWESWHGNQGRRGAANVYYSKAGFAKCAEHYGWGKDRKPLDIIPGMYKSDEYPDGVDEYLFNILIGAIDPVSFKWV